MLFNGLNLQKDVMVTYVYFAFKQTDIPKDKTKIKLRSTESLTCRFMVTSSISSCLRRLTAAGPLLDIAVTSLGFKCMPLGGFFFALCRFLPAGPWGSFLTCIGFSAGFAG